VLGVEERVRVGLCSMCYGKPEAVVARKVVATEKKAARGERSTPGSICINYNGRDKCQANLVGKRWAGTYRSSRVINQVPMVSRWKMDPTRDVIQVNPSVGSWDTVPHTLGIWGIPLKDTPIQSRWLPKLFNTAKIHHV